ncbi:MAG: HPr family phosphocarrier protein [Aeromonadaceae bacterium]|nr:HPr family phosphocarrier protein [Aeromonadaceae bacterium]
MPRIEKRLPIVNKLGLHARAAVKLVQLTASFAATVTVCNGERQADADSVIGLLMLEAAQGETIRVICEGEDAAALMAAVEQLVADRFDEHE